MKNHSITGSSQGWTYSIKKNENGEGYHIVCYIPKTKVEVKDIVSTDLKTHWQIDSIVENRDHAGKFTNPELAINSYYRLQVTEVKDRHPEP